MRRQRRSTAPPRARASTSTLDAEGAEPGAVGQLLWQKLLQAAVLVRNARAEAAPDPDAMPIGRTLGGCLLRLLLVAVLLSLALAIALAAALYFFGGSLLYDVRLDGVEAKPSQQTFSTRRGPP